MKRILAPLLLLAMWLGSYAEYRPFAPKKGYEPIFYVELLGGAFVPAFSNALNQVSSANYSPGYSEGIAIKFQVLNKYSLAVQTAMLRHEVKYGMENEYQLESSQLLLMMPLEVEWSLTPHREQVSPVISLFTGPYLLNNRNGSYRIEKTTVQLSKNDIPDWSYGVEAGLGFRLPVFSMNMRNSLAFKASYYHGLNESFALPIAQTLGESQILKSSLLSESTFSRNSGFKLTIVYEFALKKYKMTRFTAGGNGKTTYERLVIL